jgi:hypothetical protein
MRFGDFTPGSSSRPGHRRGWISLHWAPAHESQMRARMSPVDVDLCADGILTQALALRVGGGAVEHPADGRLDLLRQPGFAAGRGGADAASGYIPGSRFPGSRFRGFRRFRTCAGASASASAGADVPVATALPAYHLAEGLGQPPRSAVGAPVQLRIDAGGLAARTHQHLLAVDDAPAPRAGAPRRVSLPGRAAEAGHYSDRLRGGGVAGLPLPPPTPHSCGSTANLCGQPHWRDARTLAYSA